MANYTKTANNGFVSGLQTKLKVGTSDSDNVYVDTQQLLSGSKFDAGLGYDSLVLGNNSNLTPQKFVLGADLKGFDRVYLNSESKSDSIDASKVKNELDIYGNNGANTLKGTGFDDDIYGNDGNDVIDGGKGEDFIYGGEDNDTITGGDGDDVIYGGEDSDIITGGAGEDYLYGDNDSNSWNDGSDIFMINKLSDYTSNAGTDYIDGDGGDNDQIRFASTENGKTLVLTNAHVNSIESVVIGTGTDSVAKTTGTSKLNIDASDYSNGDFGSGGLFIQGNNGDNKIWGTDEDDLIDAGNGNDKVYGNDGDDIFVISNQGYNPSGDLYDGGDGYDAILLNTTGVTKNNNTIKFSANTANIEAFIFGQDSNRDDVTIKLDLSNLTGQNMNLKSWDNSYDIFGNNAVNTVIGSSGGETFWNMSGEDVLDGKGGDDTLLVGGSTGEDYETSVSDYASLVGNVSFQDSYTAANDNSLKNIENIELHYGSSVYVDLSSQTEGFNISSNNNFGYSYYDSSLEETVTTQSTLIGGQGDDTLYLYGEDNDFGEDTALASIEEIHNFNGEDYSSVNFGNQTEDITYYNDASGDYQFVTVGLGNGDYYGSYYTSDSYYVNAAVASDSEISLNLHGDGQGEDDSNFGFDAVTIDVTAGDLGATVVLHGDGIDGIYLANNYDDFRDEINLNIDARDMTGSVGEDQIIEANDGANIVQASNGNNIISTFDGDDTIYANFGDDVIYAGIGTDTIDAGFGNDIIWGGFGADIMTGGSGNDTYRFEDGDSTFALMDTITDFNVNGDKIDLTSLTGTIYGNVDFVQTGDSNGYADLNALRAAADLSFDNNKDIFIGRIGSDTYVVADSDQSGGITTNPTNDFVIKLSGVVSGVDHNDIIADVFIQNMA